MITRGRGGSAKQECNKLMIGPVMENTREQNAIDAYLAILKKNGVDEYNIAARETILEELGGILADQQLDGNGYRTVIETFVERKPADEWPFILSTAREFYHFWVEDIKVIAEKNKNKVYTKEEDGWMPKPVTMEKLTETLKAEKFDSAELWPLKAYKQALKNAGAGDDLIAVRSKLAKITMLRLRNCPDKNHQTYRTVVDSTLPLFKIKNSRKLFLEVVREYYHFWCGHPEAENFVLQAA